MTIRRVLVVGAVVVFALFFIFTWFGSSSNENLEDGARRAEEAEAWRKITKIYQLLEQKESSSEGKDPLNQLGVALEKLTHNTETLLKNDDRLIEGDKVVKDTSEVIQELARRIQGNFEGWAHQQDEFIQKLESKLKKLQSLQKKSQTSVFDALQSQPSKNSNAQDEIEELYEQEDKKKADKNTPPKPVTAKPPKDADPEEISDSDLHSSGTEKDEDIATGNSSDKGAEDTDAGQDAVCDEEEIEDMIEHKGVPALSNHAANSPCLFLNGRPSLYCDRKKARELGWFASPNMTALRAIVPPPYDEFDNTKFPHPSTIKIAGLASMVRSGNSWMRNLVETASGIASEAAYKREGSVTPWGSARRAKGHSSKATRGVLAGEYAFVKTHHADARYPWAKVVRLLRFPLDIEPWMRFTSNLKKENPFEHFKTSFAHEWLQWHSMWNCWPGDQLIVRYEDLVSDTACVLREVLDFLEYQYNDTDIERAINTFPPSELTEKEKESRPLGWDVPSQYLDYATQLFAVVIKEFGYQPQMNEVITWREEKGI